MVSNEKEKLTFRNKLTLVLTVSLFSSFVILTKSSAGSMAMAAISAVMLAINLWDNKGRIQVNLTEYHVYSLLFIAFTFVSAIWSVNRQGTITKGTTLLELFICTSIVMICFQQIPNKTRLLLQVIRWSGTIVAVYSIAYYGLSDILTTLENTERLGNEYANINTIGMLSAISVIIWFGIALVDRAKGRRMIRLDALSCVPCILLVAGSGSRKAFLILVIGVFLDLVLCNIENKDFLKILWKVLLAMVALWLLLSILMRMSIFDTVLSRMNGLFGALAGTDQADSSATKRLMMIDLGLDQFKKTPILGIGIGGAATAAHLRGYLHNNYVELLAGGGIVGFLCYYAKYIFLLSGYWGKRKWWNKETAIVFALICIELITEYGAVSYYSKTTSFYVLVFFIEYNEIKWHSEKNIQAEEGS